MLAPVRRSTAPHRASVIVNTLNRCDLLEQVLDGLDAQTFDDFEVIVVNGPSTDRTAEMLAARAGGIRVVSCPVARLGPSRNLGIQHAASPIIAFVDDDAIPNVDWLERLVGAYDDPVVGAAGGPVFDVPLGRIEWHVCTCTRLGVASFDSPLPIGCYAAPGADPFPYLAGCNMSFRRSVLRSIGGFHPLLSHAYDDVEVCARVIDTGCSVAFIEDALVTHHRGPSAIRNERREITDPYPIAFGRTLFALQCQYSSHTVSEIDDAMRTWMADWVDSLDPDATPIERFRERFESGIEDALGHGRSRPFFDVGSP